MAKKKATRKKKVVSNDFEIDDENQLLSIKITHDGKHLGTIEDQDYVLHRQLLEAQGDAIEAGENEKVAYIPYYASILKENYGINVTHRAAYLIAKHVCESMAGLKKNTNT